MNIGFFLRSMIVALVIIAADRFTKIWVVEWLDLRTFGELDVFPPYLNLRMAWNQGINFGLFDFGDNGRWVLVGLSVLICLGVIWWMRRASSWLMAIAVGFIIGGAVGNSWDRVIWGAVADFLNMSCCGFRNPFAFNVADIAIFFGAMLLIFFADREFQDDAKET